MSRRTLTTLFVLVLALGLAWWRVRPAPQADGLGSRSQAPLAPRLNQLEGLTRIEMTQGDDAAVLDRRDGLWVTGDATGGLPVASGEVQELLRAAARLTRDDPKTASPARHATLGLLWPDPDASARRLRVFAGDEVLADLILGNESWSPQEVTYARPFGDDQTYRCAGHVPFEPDPVVWIPGAAVQLRQDQVQWVAYDGLRLEREPVEEPEPEAQPEADADAEQENPAPTWRAKVENTTQAARWNEDEQDQARQTLPTWMETLSLDAVQPWVEPEAAQVSGVITYGLKDGSQLHVTVFRDEYEQRWIRLRADGDAPQTPPGSADEAARALARRGTHALNLPAYQLSALDRLFETPQASEAPDTEAPAE